MGLIEFITYFVPSDVREQCAGDLYEGYYRLKDEGHSEFYSGVITAWRTLTLAAVGLQMLGEDLQDEAQPKIKPVDIIPAGSPRVVIGIPVYNGENYLRKAIESVLAQTFTDFQLVISDNASTDATPDICREYAKQDHRVIHVRQAENIGAAPNHNYLFEHYGKDAPYFKWQAHDDMIEPDYLKRCVELLDADTDSSLAIAHCRAVIINEHGTQVSTCDHEVRLSGQSPSERFWRMLWAGYFTEVFGLMRSSMVKRTQLQGSFAGSDRNFLAEMVLQGNVGYVEDYLFARRDHAEYYCQIKDTADKLEWFDPKVQRDMSKFTGSIKMKTYLDAILTLPLPMRERARCLQRLVQWNLQRGIDDATGVGEHLGARFREEFYESHREKSLREHFKDAVNSLRFHRG